VDVVIPVRNGAATICATLDSVLAQTVQPRRIIVVDDGSDDGGAALVRDYPLVEIIRTDAMGVSHARNAGIRAASADFVAFVDCDDLWRHDKLERQLEIALCNRDVAVVTCDQVHVQMNGGPIPWTKDAPRFGENVFEAILSRCFTYGGWSSSMLVRRDALLQCGGFDEQLQFSEDVDFCLRLAHSHPFRHCDACLTYIRENPASTTRKAMSAAWYLEFALQQLSVVDKWVAGRSVFDPVFAQCVQVILAKFARGPLRYGRLMAFRRMIAKRAPNLAAKIGRSDAHFVFVLGLIGALRIPRFLSVALRYRMRRAARRKNMALNAADPLPLLQASRPSAE
jgi:glycosyltransferase involved in cell wall biosynthesis